MSQLKDFYNMLMEDPDIVPPKNVSKKTYALNLAQQRVKQHDNNERALELGFAKSTKGSFVDRLRAFTSPEAAPYYMQKTVPVVASSYIDLIKAPKKWYTEEGLKISPAAVNLLILDHGLNREEIRNAVKNHMKNSSQTYGVGEARYEKRHTEAEKEQRFHGYPQGLLV